MKNPYIVRSGIKSTKPTKDGCKRKKHCKGELDKSSRLVSSTHDDVVKPSDLKKTAAAHEGIRVKYNMAQRKLKQEGVNQMVACYKTFELIIPWLMLKTLKILIHLCFISAH